MWLDSYTLCPIHSRLPCQWDEECVVAVQVESQPRERECEIELLMQLVVGRDAWVWLENGGLVLSCEMDRGRQRAREWCKGAVESCFSCLLLLFAFRTR